MRVFSIGIVGAGVVRQEDLMSGDRSDESFLHRRWYVHLPGEGGKGWDGAGREGKGREWGGEG